MEPFVSQGGRTVVAAGASRYVARVPRRAGLLLVGCLLSGCLWRSYEHVLEVHLTVLLQMTDKLCGLADSGRTPTAADMVEFTYPAQRGRAFLRQFARHADRPSYRDFQGLLEQYEAMLKRVDAARVNEAQWRAEHAAAARERVVLSQLAERIRQDLRR
jgi:hypothetical protein